jgi:hypothetical protein
LDVEPVMAGIPTKEAEVPMLSMDEENGARPDPEPKLPGGARVQVRSRFDGDWTSGFQVFAAQADGRYLVRRLSDRSMLPIAFAESDLRLDPVRLPAPSPWSPSTVA